MTKPLKPQDLSDLVWLRRMLQEGRARELRESAGLSLREMGDQLGVHFSSVQKYETGDRHPSTAVAHRYARLLRVIASS